VFPPHKTIPNDLDALSTVRDHLSRFPECQEWDAHELALTLRLSGAEVQGALEALTVDGELLA
jgi:hypothetical protein